MEREALRSALRTVRAARLVVLLHGDVDHEAVRRGAVPVVLARLEEDAIAGPDDLDLPALALAEADAFDDEDRLSVRVGVPRGACARGEVHERGGERRAAGRGGDGVDVDVAREPVSRPLLRVDAAAGDLHAAPLGISGAGRPARASARRTTVDRARASWAAVTRPAPHRR